MSTPTRKLCGAIALVLLLLTTSACTERVLHGLSERNALFVTELLRRENITANIRRGSEDTYDIAVPRNERNAARALLGQLPPLQAERLSDELWQQSGLLPSQQAESLWGQRRAAREVELTLASIPWVQDARVLPSFGEAQDDLTEVGVMLLTHRSLRTGEGDAIARLVAAAFSGIAQSDVTVVPVTILNPTTPPENEQPRRSLWPHAGATR